MAPPSWLATQPPTAIMRPGLARFRCLTRPRSANTFSCAFSRTEQVLKTMTSASSALAAGARPSACGEHAGDLLRVVLVHLAAEGADEELARHDRPRYFFGSGCAASCGERIQARRTWPSGVELVLDRARRAAGRSAPRSCCGHRGSARRPRARSACRRSRRSSPARGSSSPRFASAGMVRRLRLRGAAPRRRRKARQSAGCGSLGQCTEKEMVANQGLEPRTNGL